MVRVTDRLNTTIAVDWDIKSKPKVITWSSVIVFNRAEVSGDMKGSSQARQPAYIFR